MEVTNIESGFPPDIDLKEELKNGNFIRKLITEKIIIGCHDLSDGGIILGISEMVLSSNLGVEITIPELECSVNEWLFGEDQSRYIIITKKPEKLKELSENEGIFIENIGKVKGNSLNIKNSFEISVKDLNTYNKKWFSEYAS